MIVQDKIKLPHSIDAAVKESILKSGFDEKCVTSSGRGTCEAVDDLSSWLAEKRKSYQAAKALRDRKQIELRARSDEIEEGERIERRR